MIVKGFALEVRGCGHFGRAEVRRVRGRKGGILNVDDFVVIGEMFRGLVGMK